MLTGAGACFVCSPRTLMAICVCFMFYVYCYFTLKGGTTFEPLRTDTGDESVVDAALPFLPAGEH